MALSDAKQCRGISKRTGERCRQPAMKGMDVCRFHCEETCGDGDAGENMAESSPNTVGAPKANTNALKHGAYSPRLLPEEEPIYEEKRKAFTAALGTVDVFDEQILHLLSLISTKVDQAVLKGAEHAAYGGMIKQILDLMKELKATRASRDPVEAGAALTYADLFAALKERFGESMDGCGVGNTSSDKEIVERRCSRCGFTMAHQLEDDGRWRCQNCGHVTETEIEAEAPKHTESDGDDKSATEASNAISG